MFAGMAGSGWERAYGGPASIAFFVSNMLAFIISLCIILYIWGLGSIPLIKRLTHLPIIVDPSHGTGDRASVPAMARAAVALGADGLMVEVHPEPEKALSDGPQSLTPAGFAALMESVRAIAPLVGLTVSRGDGVK
jgi:3-deoxy-D-manno-octulosonic acid (KDO) 8-phosphate synthase